MLKIKRGRVDIYGHIPPVVEKLKMPLTSAGKSTSMIHRARQEAIERLAEVR